MTLTVDGELHRIWITGFRSYELGVMGTKDPKLMVIKYALRKILENAIQDGTAVSYTHLTLPTKRIV